MVWKNLTDISTIKALLAKKGVCPQRSSGQHFLVCEEVVEATLLALSNEVTEITELGAGLGTLTQALLGAGYKVKAVERDAALNDLIWFGIPKNLKGNLDLIRGDLREVNWSWQKAYQLVGNIPYNLSGLIIRRLTLLNPAPDRVVLLVQREVGKRLTASEGSLSLIGVAVQLWGSAESLLNVPASCFWPVPQVDSQLVLLIPRTGAGATSAERREKVLTLARQFFQTKRKQMGGRMRQLLGIKTERAEKMLREANIEPIMRPQEVSIKAWLALSRVVYSKE
ncbi:MAG: rRNA adenine dimethyltransferase family protein [bacterium]